MTYDQWCDSLNPRTPCRICSQPSRTDVCAECHAMQTDAMQPIRECQSPRAVMRRERNDK